MDDEKKINVNNPKNYTFRAMEFCIRQDCLKPVEWWIDEFEIGLCDSCYGEIDKL